VETQHLLPSAEVIRPLRPDPGTYAQVLPGGYLVVQVQSEAQVASLRQHGGLGVRDQRMLTCRYGDNWGYDADTGTVIIPAAIEASSWSRQDIYSLLHEQGHHATRDCSPYRMVRELEAWAYALRCLRAEELEARAYALMCLQTYGDLDGWSPCEIAESLTELGH